MNNVDVIIPVYRGLEETKECIISAFKSLPSFANLIIINDKSPEHELTKWLQDNKNKYQYSLYENEENLGFVATVNFGMKINKEHDVLLLNSDVEVSKYNWLERIRDAAYSKEKLASITPFSNNATICSFPNFCEDNELFANCNVDELDYLFKKICSKSEDILVPVPTGVGFCMYIRRDCLDDVGYFDEKTFGKGYGEENDWCQRAIKKGWINYHQMNVFAYHKGGVSFAEEGDPRKEKALELLLSLHPNYTKDVHKFIQEDPAFKYRAAAILSFFNSSENKNIMLVSHALGGGVKQHVNELINLYGETVNFVLASPEKNKMSLEFYSMSSKINFNLFFNLSIKDELDRFNFIFNLINIDRVHIHHVMGISKEFLDIILGSNVLYDLTIHDYYLFNGNPTLTDEDGSFIDISDIDERDQRCSIRYPLSESIKAFKKKSIKLLTKADRIIYPSLDTCIRFEREYGDIASGFVAYHPDIDEKNIRMSVKSRELDLKPLKVLVLGALSQEKGADELEYVAKYNKDIEFHLLGYAYKPLDSVITHGPYEQSEVENRINDISPDLIWFPAKWPETYSYTLSIALTLPYKIICHNIGAFGERIASQKGALLLKSGLSLYELSEFWKLYNNDKSVAPFLDKTNDFDNSVINKDFYNKEYLNFKKCSFNNIEYDLFEVLDGITENRLKLTLTKKEKLLLLLWRLRNNKLFSKLSTFVPFKVQRFIKRKLSSKPIHDIVKK